MNLVAAALRRPITLIVIFASLIIFAVMSLMKIPIDIFPALNMPTIYIVEPYGGMSPQQMEGFFSTGLQDQFLYVNGIKSIESKNTQGLTFIKLSFYENTNMAEASSQVATYVNRALKFFPPGALPPLVVRFDASSLPVGELVFSSQTKTLNEIYDLASTRVRPMFASVQGLSAPPAMGGNARSVLVNVDPEKIRAYDVTPEELVQALSKANVMAPSGNLREGNIMYMTTLNSLEEKVQEFADIPVKTKEDKTVFVSDLAKVSDGADITVSYALINGRRSIYIPVVKTADASTWEVVKNLKAKIPEMQSLLPDDVHLNYEFDQSVFVINAVKSLATEGILGAILTGLMVLLFLGDLRSSMIVIVTIPVSILIGCLMLSLAGQTINLMTLSGLALAIGILVDQATVTIENIHQHLEMGKTKRDAIYDACAEISFPLLLILLCILAVFAPSFMMSGVPKAMFLPLSLSIGFSMIVSFIAAQTLVPILCNWFLPEHDATHPAKYANATLALTDIEVQQTTHDMSEEHRMEENKDLFHKVRDRFTTIIEHMMLHKKLYGSIYLIGSISLAALAFIFIGKDLMPKVNNGQFQMRLKAPEGTRLERTEEKVQRMLAIIDSTVDGHVEISSAYVGIVPSNYATSNLYVFNAGSHEAVIQVQVDEKYKMKMDELKEALRRNIHHFMPDVAISFEPIDLTEKIMSQGAANPIEVRVAGKDMAQITAVADTLLHRMEKIPELRDVQIQQPLHYPTIAINIDRYKVAQFGLDMDKVASSVTSATTSSRFIEKNLWLDARTAYTYQVQVQVPEYMMATLNELREVPLVKGQNRPILGDVATFTQTTTPGEYDRAGPRRFLTVGAGIHETDLGRATADVRRVVGSLGQLPKGVKVEVRGTSSLLDETLGSLQTGLALAVLVILLLLAANYESIPTAFTVISTVPAVILGAMVALFATGATLNLQSYMGMIMSTGVSVANAILIVTNAEKLRLEVHDATRAAVMSASVRLRPILMTSLAMIVGMIPMASGLGEAGEQTAPLGRAVIGGLLASTFAALFMLPLIYAWVRQRASFDSTSLLPHPQSNN
ncbi:MAG: efflux RND transporter permease subunit [Bacteroidetes bacterium]|nr:efflux RND transporter permease subunit [Bacteroidota bacterium]